MLTIPVESVQFSDLKNGNPLQIRASIKPDQLKTLNKGAGIQLECDGSTMNATLISDPMVVINRPETDHQEVSLEVRES